MSMIFQARLSAASKVPWTGEIIPIQLEQEPYEVEVSARGSYFHLLIGLTPMGTFSVFPTGILEQNWHLFQTPFGIWNDLAVQS